MQVLPFFTLNKDLIKEFDSFLRGYDKLLTEDQDNDTIFFTNLDGQNEIYFHFIPDDVEYEFSYNYSEDEQSQIKFHLGNQNIILFSIQYRNESFLQKLLLKFKYHLQQKAAFNQTTILICHPLDGIIKFM